MNHFPEHILELFARNSPDVSEQRAAIGQHCAECFSCREMVREMTEFYFAAEAKTLLLEPAASETNALVMEAQISQRQVSPVYVSHALPARIVRFIRRRPVTSSFFGIVVLLLGYFSFSKVIHFSTSSPIYHQFNVQDNSVVLFDKFDKILWKLKLNSDVKDLKSSEDSYFTLKVIEFDLNRDGINEVIIIPPVTNEENQKDHAKLFNKAGERIGYLSVPFREIKFGTKIYNAEFYPSVLKADRHKKHLLVSYTNGRSPTIIARYGNNGALLGTYWHFGQLNSLVYFDVDHDGTDELVISGINDTEDETERSFAVTIILDPEKIVGNTESSAARGFGQPVSDAELRYIRYPNPEIIQNVPVNLIAKTSAYKREKYLRVLTDAKFDQSLIALEYFYDSTMTVKDVKFDASTLYYHSTLFKQGKLKQPINDEYTRSLVRSVLYWEGNEWKTHPSKDAQQFSNN